MKKLIKSGFEKDDKNYEENFEKKNGENFIVQF
jgi:hypothetical protein